MTAAMRSTYLGGLIWHGRVVVPSVAGVEVVVEYIHSPVILNWRGKVCAMLNKEVVVAAPSICWDTDSTRPASILDRPECLASSAIPAGAANAQVMRFVVNFKALQVGIGLKLVDNSYLLAHKLSLR